MNETDTSATRKEILDFLKKSDDSYTQVGNIYYAEKAFVVNSVAQWLVGKVNSEEWTRDRLPFYLDTIKKYIQNKVQLEWNENGNLVIKSAEE